MVMELEQLRDRFNQEGHRLVASELDLILRRHRDFLPPSLSLKGASTEPTQFQITADLLEKPEYTPRLLDMFDVLIRPGTQALKLRRVVGQTKAALMFYWHYEKHMQVSMNEILNLPDDKLLGIPGFGPVCLRTFKSGKELIQQSLLPENQSSSI